MIPEETGAVRHRGNLVQISEFFGRVIAAASCPDFPFAPAQPTFALEAKERGLATASVGRAQGFVEGSRAFRAPLQRDGLAVWGQGRGHCQSKFYTAS
jgi:hypothetical protein